MKGNTTIVVLHEHAAVIELIEAALRDRGLLVLGTLDAFEAAQIVRRVKVDLVVLSRSRRELAENLRAVQAGLPVVVLNGEPMWVDEIADAVVAALPSRRERS